MSDLNAVLNRNPGAAYRVYDGQATIILPGRAAVHVLNALGTVVWDRIDGTRTVGQIVGEVLGDYEVSAEEAQRDVLEFIEALRDQGMVS